MNPVPPGRFTATGVFLFIVVPSPNWPLALRPQAKTAPSFLRAIEWSLPPAMTG
jgi:hypothetical protein